MLIKELISEAISLTHYENEFKKAIQNGLRAGLFKVLAKHNQESILNNPKLLRMVTNPLEKSLEELINNQLKLSKKIMVTFVDPELIDAHGGSKDRYITLSTDYIRQLIIDPNDVNELVGTVIHELTHYQQHVRQKANKYYSNHEEQSDDNAYYADPQEIGAHAHNITLDIVHDVGLDQARSLDQVATIIKTITPTLIVKHIDKTIGANRFKDGASSSTIRNRYYKMVYQELQRYIEKVKEREKLS